MTVASNEVVEYKSAARPKKVWIETLGCQMNVADSEEMSRHFTDKGIYAASSKEDADIVLLNTCTIRQHAEDKALSFIGRMRPWKEQDPDRVLIVAGCAAQRLKGTLKKRFPFIDLVTGAKEIEEFPKLVEQVLGPGNGKGGFDWFSESENSFGKGNLRSKGKPFSLGIPEETAFVTIMRGCNYSCSYCIVPYVRGREIYRPPKKILREIEEKVRAGATKVMLLGQTVNSYWYKNADGGGKNHLTDFPDLLSEVNSLEGVKEIRFMSPHPHYMTDKLMDALSQNGKVSNEIHLPVQSGSNKILKAMKRNYTREEYLEIVFKLKKSLPSLALSTDFIAGFPGETEEDFKESLSLIDEAGFSIAYCFKYSKRAGTESHSFKDDVPEPEKEDRLSRLLEKFESRNRV